MISVYNTEETWKSIILHPNLEEGLLTWIIDLDTYKGSCILVPTRTP